MGKANISKSKKQASGAVKPGAKLQSKPAKPNPGSKRQIQHAKPGIVPEIPIFIYSKQGGLHEISQAPGLPSPKPEEAFNETRQTNQNPAALSKRALNSQQEPEEPAIRAHLQTKDSFLPFRKIMPYESSTTYCEISGALQAYQAVFFAIVLAISLALAGFLASLAPSVRVSSALAFLLLA
ncbi:MAG TPA: hypothetical protein PLO51_00325, partial [Candidatus Micrarchaeota archaeon]|nr:hypothetical protein [Candidatus Micrarchaeota archaeon]